EIAIARWMPVQEFLNNPHVHPFNKFVIQAVLGREGWSRHVSQTGHQAGPIEIFAPAHLSPPL
ncbi:MAG: hypothetical protein D6775_13705, partial [Caldilineae bacterium]